MSEDVTISVSEIHKSYGSIKAVDGLSFSVLEGEVYSLLGPNGAGKTTTVEMLEGLRKPDSGQIRILGKDPWHSAGILRTEVGVMPQDFRFMDRINPAEAIQFYSTIFNVPDKSDELLDLVELSDMKRVHFQNLSGGQKQKLGICLALVNDPRIVFLDEPTTGLDPKARRKIWELISKLKSEGRTVILTTHYLEEAQILADRVGIVDHGRMIVEGSPQEIISKMGKGRRLRLVNDKRLSDFIATELGLDSLTSTNELAVSVRNNMDVVRILEFAEKNGIELSSLSLKEDTLEDIFVDLVSKEDEQQ